LKIRAAVLSKDSSHLDIETLTLEPARADEVIVRLVATGVCHTDIKHSEPGGIVPRPAVLGHEGAGIVVATGSAVTRVKAGDPVVLSYDYCSTCASCLAGARSYCHELRPRNFGGTRPDGTSPLSRDGTFIHGSFFGQSSFATHAMAYERNVVKVPREAPLERLGPLGCGVQTGAGAIINAFKAEAGCTVAVIGSGAVGLSAVMAARLIGARRIIAVDLHDNRLDLARELGATRVLNAARADIVREALAITGHGVDYVLDTTTLVPVMEQGIAMLAPRGTFAFVAGPGGTATLPLPLGHMLLGGRSVRGIIEGDSPSDTFIPMLIDLFMQGRFPFDRMIEFYPFERINDAIADSNSGRVIKPVLRFEAAAAD
jgi:aryl-alcohol dehydrogenase